MIDEFMNAAVEVFGDNVLLQFEDFNSNDAFPLLASTRRFLTYNDDIQARQQSQSRAWSTETQVPTRDRSPDKVKNETICFSGLARQTLVRPASCTARTAVCQSRIFMTGSRGLIWKVRTILRTFPPTGVRCFT